jgi:hypothetical protein
MLPQHQAHNFFSGHVSANSQRSFLLFSPVTRTTYQASSSSSQLESLTRSSSFLLHILGHTFPRCVFLLVCLRVFFHTFLLLRKVLDLSCSFCQKETRVSLGLQEKLPSVVLRADSFLSPQPDPPCFHSLGWLIVQPPVLFLLTDFSLGSG